MTGLLKSLAVKLIRGHWGRVVPSILKAAGEGDFGPQIKAVYWFAEKYATVTGAVLWGIGAAAETVCGGYPEYVWTCNIPGYVLLAGQVLTAAGLLRGATNSPWPDKSRADVKKELKAEAAIDAKELKEK